MPSDQCNHVHDDFGCLGCYLSALRVAADGGRCETCGQGPRVVAELLVALDTARAELKMLKGAIEAGRGFDADGVPMDSLCANCGHRNGDHPAVEGHTCCGDRLAPIHADRCQCRRFVRELGGG